MKILIAVASLVVVLLAAIGWYFWDSSRNRGSLSGYYGEYNRVSNALASIPGVSITNGWYNGDVTLEEIGFGLTINEKAVYLFFSETDPIREMKHEAAVAALKGRIAAELAASSQTNK